MALGRGEKTPREPKVPSRFVRIHVDPGKIGRHDFYSIVRDNETGVCYITMQVLFGAAGGGSMTPLLDAEGKPVIDHESPEV